MRMRRRPVLQTADGVRGACFKDPDGSILAVGERP